MCILTHNKMRWLRHKQASWDPSRLVLNPSNEYRSEVETDLTGVSSSTWCQLLPLHPYAVITVGLGWLKLLKFCEYCMSSLSQFEDSHFVFFSTKLFVISDNCWLKTQIQIIPVLIEAPEDVKLVMGPQSENKEKLFSHRAHGQESISEEITNPQRLYLATCNLTSVVLTARETRYPHSPVFNFKWNQLLDCLLSGVQSGIRQQTSPHCFPLLP